MLSLSELLTPPQIITLAFGHILTAKHGNILHTPNQYTPIK